MKKQFVWYNPKPFPEHSDRTPETRTADLKWLQKAVLLPYKSKGDNDYVLIDAEQPWVRVNYAENCAQAIDNFNMFKEPYRTTAVKVEKAGIIGLDGAAVVDYASKGCVLLSVDLVAKYAAVSCTQGNFLHIGADENTLHRTSLKPDTIISFPEFAHMSVWTTEVSRYTLKVVLKP
jgi:hypothetical protein